MNKLIIGLLLSVSAFHVLAQEALTTVASVNVPRYMGTWYEIAKYPNWFQRKCISNTSAQYSPQTDGTVRVQNRCTQEDGKVSEAIGQARQIGESTSPKLQVRFAPE